MKRILHYFAIGAIALSLLSGCNKNSDATDIVLSDENILVNGSAISTDDQSDVYVANDIIFYLEGQDFTYGEGTEKDAHSQDEADAHAVVHISAPGTYRISGSLSAGQIAVDLGKEAKDDPNAVVNLILNNANITCSVAPAVIFYNVYECGDSDAKNASKDVDTSKAGANVILADNSTNTVTGSYVARIYESYVLNDEGTEVIDSEKLHKYDGAFYSKMSMNISGESSGNGVLNINAENEGLDSELHLTVNSGNINITSGNDGINTNEDEVSVTTLNGGNLNILVTGETGEGDGIDSNGWLVINGGTLTAQACSTSGDAGIDSDMGIHINGGTILSGGNMLDRISESAQNYAVFQFSQPQKGGSNYILKTADGDAVAEYTPENDFSYLIFSSSQLAEGTYSLWKDDIQLSARSGNMGNGMGGGPTRQIQEGIEPPEGMEISEGKDISRGGKPGMSEGELPQGERPEMPEGGQMPPDDKMPQGEPPQDGSATEIPTAVSTELKIKTGGNYFIIVM